MSDKTNEEKLRILQERLAQIQHKKEAPKPTISAEQAVQKEQIADKTPPSRPKKKPQRWLFLKVILFISAIVLGGNYIIENVRFSDLIPDFTSEEVTKQAEIAPLSYTLNFEGATHIIIVGSFEDEGTAKAMTNDKKVKGYTTDYFFLPEVSNSEDEVYKVYIGPYYSSEETNQWANSLEAGTYEVLEL